MKDAGLLLLLLDASPVHAGAGCAGVLLYPEMDSSPRLGIALGGGAARGFFHVGVVRALAEAGIRPDVWCGTSAGSVVGAACAAGLPHDRMLELATCVRWTENVVGLGRSALDWAVAFPRLMGWRKGERRPGLVDTSRIGDYVNATVGGRRFSEIEPLIVTACDIHTGEKLLFCAPAVAQALERAREPAGRRLPWQERYLTHDVVVPFEDVGVAVRCSTCIPTLMSSVTLDCPTTSGTVVRRMVNDGLLAELVPARVLRLLGCRKVIAVLLGLIPQKPEVAHLVDVGLNSIQYFAREQIRTSLEAADYVLYDPAIEGRSLVSLDVSLIDQGYRFTRECLPEIRAMLDAPDRMETARDAAASI